MYFASESKGRKKTFKNNGSPKSLKINSGYKVAKYKQP